jgi:hypothetical protein
VDFSPLLPASCLEPSGKAVEIQKICFVARATGSHIILKIHKLDFKVFEKNMHGPTMYTASLQIPKIPCILGSTKMIILEVLDFPLFTTCRSTLLSFLLSKNIRYYIVEYTIDSMHVLVSKIN